MAYSSGGLIEATDYNNFLNGSNQLNTVWSTGSGATGYGQTALDTVSAGGIVTATQWASLINTLNNTRNHQVGSGSGITAVSAGARVDYLSSLQTSIDSAYTDRALYASQGSTTTGTTKNFTATTGQGGNLPETTLGGVYPRVTWASADSMRYFFNAGGAISYVMISCTSNNGTARSNDVADIVQNKLGTVTLLNATAAKTGSGGTVNTNLSSSGVRSLNNTWAIWHQITSTNATYSGNNIKFYLRSEGTTGANGDVGAWIECAYNLTSPNKTWDDALNITLNCRIDIIYPESTYLTSSWGTPTVS